MMIIAPNSHVHKGKKEVRGKYGGLVGLLPVSFDRADQHSRGRQQRVQGGLRGLLYGVVVCVVVLMGRVTGTLPLCGG